MGTSNSSAKDKHHLPRVVWKWEAFPGSFVAYSAHSSALIEKHFLSGSREILVRKAENYYTYDIDVVNMVQINQVTQRKRRIRREVLRDSFSTIRWCWENNMTDMQPYTLDVSDRIEACYQKGDKSFIKVKIGAFHYKIIPSEKIQINLATNSIRRIERNTLQDHKYTWQMEQEDSTFTDFDEPDSIKIELHYLARKGKEIKIVMSEKEYIIDTEKMCMRDVLTQKERQIRRVQENYVQYKWLWRQKENGWINWVAFSPELTEKFETNYLSSKQCILLLDIEGEQYDIDTISLIKKRKTDGKYWKMKREPVSNDRPVWVWKTKHGSLKTFPEFISKQLEMKYILNDETSMKLENIKIGEKLFHINLKTMEIVNEETGNKKQIERHIISNFYPSALETISESERLKVMKFLTESGYLPLEWEWSKNQATSVVVVSDRERNFLTSQFYSSMEENKYTIENIDRIQDIFQVNNFLLEKRNIQCFSHDVNESILLFYLSNGEPPTEFYGKECALENKISPKNEYGKGLYFSKSAKFCHSFAHKNDNQTRVLVLFMVMLGKIQNITDDHEVEELYQGKYKTRKEIRKPPKTMDSISGVIDGEEVFIIHNPERCYPLYLIHYHENDI